MSADPLAIHAVVKTDERNRKTVDHRLLNPYSYVSGHALIAVDLSGLLEFEIAVSDQLLMSGDEVNALKTATAAMVGRMQDELQKYFGIATTRENDWNGTDLHLASQDLQDKALSDAAGRMRAAGATSADIAKWTAARARLVGWIASDNEIEIETTTGGTPTKSGTPLMFAQTSGGLLTISMNPYSWFSRSGADITRASSAGAKAQMGPTMSQLHETGHAQGCMTGSKDCQAASGYEQATTDDVNDHTRGVPDLVSRPVYDSGDVRPGGYVTLEPGERTEIPTATELTNGAP